MGLPLVINPQIGVAIAVSTGDAGTGRADRDVRTKYGKGDATSVVLAQNEMQLEFDMGEAAFRAKYPDTAKPRYATWYLLRRRVADVIHSELSLPMKIGEKGKITGWKERIIFPDYLLGPEFEVGSEQDDSNDEIVVDVERI